MKNYLGPVKNPMKDPISEGLLVKSWSNYLRAWISLKGGWLYPSFFRPLIIEGLIQMNERLIGMKNPVSLDFGS